MPSPNLKFKFLILLSLFLTSYLLLFTFSSAQENNSNKIIDFRQQIQGLERQSAEYKKQIIQKRKESETLKRELSILENQIARLRINIIANTQRIELTGLEIRDLAGEISATENKIGKIKESISGLLKELNVFEKRDLAVILLTNPRISYFFNHIERVSGLQERLTANLSVFLELKSQLEGKKGEAENKKQEFEVLNKRQRNQRTAFEGSQAAKNDLFSKTKGQEQKFQELLSEVERKKAEFYKELKKFESEAREEGIYIVKVKAASTPPKGSKLFKMPIDDYIITQGYGMTAFAKRGIYGGAPHNGIDLKAGQGSEIKSIGLGTVLAKGFNNAAGNWVAIRHDNDLVSVYGHMRDPSLVLAGEKVDENTVLGYEGMTGFATGSHLHLSLYQEFFSFIGPKTGQVYFNYWQGSLNPFDYLYD
ncbi:MAG: peptidoglycan DD-metalloendopeptidase family protein [Patescibacteria group bacterium]